MKHRCITTLAFPGFEPLDVVGPFEVFAGATRAAPMLGRSGGYRVEAASTTGQMADPDPICLQDGKFWTSAGVTAGMDLALALVHDDLGVEVAQTVARSVRHSPECSPSRSARRLVGSWSRCVSRQPGMAGARLGVDHLQQSDGGDRFGTAETSRRVFHRRLNVAPDAYRRRFRVIPNQRTSA